MNTRFLTQTRKAQAVCGALTLGVLALSATASHAGYDSDNTMAMGSTSRNSATRDSMDDRAMVSSPMNGMSGNLRMSTSAPRMTTMALGGRSKMQVRRVDPQMKMVLRSLMALKPKPVEKLSPANARVQPNIADAVALTLRKMGRSLAPEAVASVMNTTVPGPNGAIPVRIYKPRTNMSTKLPVVVYFHGGGFVLFDRDVYDSSARALSNAAGAMVVSVGYRRAPESRLPAAHEDSYAATQYIMKNASKFGGDPSRVAVAGESVGGNLATDVCLMAKMRGGKMPIYQVLVYPVSDFTPASLNAPSALENRYAKPLNRAMLAWFGKYALPYPSFVNNALASPLKFADVRGLPPATVILAEIDPLRSQGEAYARKLAAAGIPTRVRLYQGVTHEFFGTGAVVNQAKQAVDFAAAGLKSAFAKAG